MSDDKSDEASKNPFCLVLADPVDEFIKLAEGQPPAPEPTQCPACGQRIKRDLVRGKKLNRLRAVK